MLPSTLTTSHVWLLSLCLWLEDWELYFLYYVDLINWNVSLSSHIWLVATINMLDNAVLQHFSSACKNTSTDSATTYASILPMETSKGADPPFFCFSSLFHPKEVSDENAFLLDFYCCWNKWLLTEWLPTTQVSSLRFLETRSPQGISLGLNQSVGRTVFFWRLQARICFLDFSRFWRSPTVLGLWPISLSSKSAVDHLQIFHWLCCHQHVPSLILSDSISPSSYLWGSL